MLVPLSIPVRRSIDHPVLLLRCELVPRRVARDARRLGVAHQVILALLPGWRLHGFDGTGAQRQLLIGDDQSIVDADHPAKATAGFAGTHRRVEREHGGNWIGVAQITLRAMQASGEFPEDGGGVDLSFKLVNHQASAAVLEGDLNCLEHASAFGRAQPKAVSHHIKHLARARHGGDFALRLHLGKAADREPLLHLLRRCTARQLDREGHRHTGVGLSSEPDHLRVNGLGRVMPHGLCRIAVK